MLYSMAAHIIPVLLPIPVLLVSSYLLVMEII